MCSGLALMQEPAMDEADYPYAAQQAVTLSKPRLGMQCRGLDEPLDLSQARALSWFVVVVTMFGLVDGVLYPLTDVVARRSIVELAMFAAAGLIVAQAAMISAAFVFAPGPLAVRASACWLAALALLGCWLGGMAVHRTLNPGNVWAQEPSILEQATWSTLLLLPGALVFFPAPLWFFRLYLGWSLIRTGGEATPWPPAQPLTIRHYFLAMTTAAAALALVRWHGTAGIEAAEFAAIVALWAMAGAIGCLLTVPPAMLLLLRDLRWPVGLALFALYVVLLASLPLAAAIRLNWGANHWLGLYEFTLFYIPFVAWGTAVAACLAIPRLAGYRLRTGAERKHRQQQDCGAPQE
jgi:hypothetical protein